MFRNDPDMGAIPAVGKGSVDIGKRTLVGEAVIYDGTDPDALITFLGDTAIRNIAGELYRTQEGGTLVPMAKLKLPAIIVRPPAGDWFTITEDALVQEYAIHVNVPAVSAPRAATAGTGGSGGAGYVALGAGAGGVAGAPVIAVTTDTSNPLGAAATKKAAAKKAPAKKAAAAKK